MLQAIKESWPGPGPNKIRLPAGRYVSPARSTWCRHIDWNRQEIARAQVAKRLLESQCLPTSYRSTRQTQSHHQSNLFREKGRSMQQWGLQDAWSRR